MVGITTTKEREMGYPDRGAKSQQEILTVEEAAKLLRIGRNAAYEAARRGEIPVIKIGKRLLVPRLALNKLLGMEASAGSPRA
jgi:excisionase family DNA binding protein